MQVIPLFEDARDRRQELKDIEISIPSDWWNSSYSFNYSKITNPPVYEFKKREVPKFKTTSGWNIKKGDYKVRESRVNTHDYVYYRDLKIKLLKYSIYPVLIVTVLLIFKLSDILSKM